MMTSIQIAVRYVHLGFLWGASLLVPSAKRSEWSQEWRTELWYVLRECFSERGVSPRSIRKTTTFCMGAYRDATWLRRRSWQEQQLLLEVRSSAALCLLLLIAILFATWRIAHISPRVAAGTSRIEVHSWRVSDRRAAPCDCPVDFIGEGRSLPTARLFFDGFSHYKVAREMVWAEAMPGTEWTVAQARSDFFAVLHLPMRSMERVGTGLGAFPQLVLSQETWIRDFGGDPNIGGAKLHVGSMDAIVAGVTFGASMGLPGKANAWLLSADPQIGADAAEFAAGHLSPVGYFNYGRWALSVGGIFLGLLLMAVAHPSIGEYGSGSHKPPLRSRSRSWAFLMAKISLLLAIAYFASVDLDCSLVQPLSQFSGCIQAGSSFAFCYLGLNWAFRDQQHRCPVCLRRMAHPINVGQPSRTFLSWNGTELLCERGHTLLHIPLVRTSWFEVQRWVCLDQSWQFLFAPPGPPSTWP